MAVVLHSGIGSPMDSVTPPSQPVLLPGELAICQVDGCNGDLSGHKEYYRRHRVCEMHAKAVQVSVGNETQRFCQQCSRFHMLDSFDEGKRSCRRRLLGHNRRRRKQSLTGDGWPAIRNDAGQLGDRLRNQNLLQRDSKRLRLSSGQPILVGADNNMLRLTDNMDYSGVRGDMTSGLPFSGQSSIRPLNADGQNVGSFSHFVPSLTSSELSLLLPQRRNNSSSVPPGSPAVQPVTSILLRQAAELKAAAQAVAQAGSTDSTRNLQTGPYIGLLTSGAPGFHQPSSSITPSGDFEPSASRDMTGMASQPLNVLDDRVGSGQYGGIGDNQVPDDNNDRTGRASFKLFDRRLEDLPTDLMEQIVDWLGRNPFVLESYSREGCSVLSLITRLAAGEWSKIGASLQENLERLMSGSEFWARGAILVQWENDMAFIRDGKVSQIQSPLLRRVPFIAGVKPLCIVPGEPALLTVTGYNLCSPDAQIICYNRGKVHKEAGLQPETQQYSSEQNDLGKRNEELGKGRRKEETRVLVPEVDGVLCGQMFVEVEHLIGPYSSNVWPVLVAEKDVCADICTLEKYLDLDPLAFKTGSGSELNLQVSGTLLEVLHDLGWALQELNHLKIEIEVKDGDIPVSDEVSATLSRYHLPDPALEALIQLCISRGLWEITKRLLDLAVERRKLV